MPHQEGQLTVREAAAALGVDQLFVRRLDAEVFAGTPRAGVRTFSPGDVDALRQALAARRAKRKARGASVSPAGADKTERDEPSRPAARRARQGQTANRGELETEKE